MREQHSSTLYGLARRRHHILCPARECMTFGASTQRAGVLDVLSPTAPDPSVSSRSDSPGAAHRIFRGAQHARPLSAADSSKAYSQSSAGPTRPVGDWYRLNPDFLRVPLTSPATCRRVLVTSLRPAGIGRGSQRSYSLATLGPHHGHPAAAGTRQRQLEAPRRVLNVERVLVSFA